MSKTATVLPLSTFTKSTRTPKLFLTSGGYFHAAASVIAYHFVSSPSASGCSFQNAFSLVLLMTLIPLCTFCLRRARSQVEHHRTGELPSRRLRGRRLGRGEDLHRDVRRQQVLQLLLEAALDQLVDRPPAAAADQHLAHAVDRGGFGDQLRRVGAGVVHRDDRHPVAVAVLEKVGEQRLRG